MDPNHDINADAALTRLLEGNARYMAGRPMHPHQSPARRAALVDGQQPFAAVLGCADSRVPPEVLFDCGLGDIFVVRSAGNIADDFALASLVYAVEHLAVPLLMVLGHTRCGALTAAAGEVPEGELAGLVTALQPAVAAAAGDIDRAVRRHARREAERLARESPAMAAAVRAGRLRMVAACYNVVGGAVELLD